MKKIVKAITATLVAGAVCAGAGAFAGCKTKEVPGKSAYEIAVENGFKGTEQEWLDSLKVTEEITVQTTVENCTVSYSVNEYGYRVATFTFTMSDGTTQVKKEVLPASVVNVELPHSTVIWTEAEIESKNYNLAGLNWEVTYDTGYTEYLPLTKAQILEVVSEEDAAEPGNSYRENMYNVSAIFNSVWGTVERFNVFAVEDLDDFNESYQPNAHISQAGYCCRVGETYGLNNVFVQNYYNEVTVTRHNGYDEGTQEDHISSVRYQAVTAEMFDKAIDTSTVGYKEYNVTVGEGDSAIKDSVNIEVYDKAVTNVRYCGFQDDEVEKRITITAGADLAAAARAAYKDKKVSIEYFEPVNGSTHGTDTITEAMIDISAVDAATPGNYNMTITVQGYVIKIEVRVNPDMTGATVDKTLTGEGMTILYLFEQMLVNKADLYTNGYAVLYTEDEGDYMPLTKEVGYVGYTLENNVLIVKYGSENLAIFSVNETENTFGAYTFGEATATYTGVMNMGEEVAFTLKTYSNGFAEMIMSMGPEQTATMVLGYVKDGNALKIAPTDVGIKFTIGENNVVTDNFEEAF